jgi:hypothetical protein
VTENKELFADMAKAFASIEGATKDSTNPHFKAKYADLSSVVSAIKPSLIANNLWFAQITHEQSGGVCVETLLCHTNGDNFSFGKLFVPASKQDAQGYGSALTYARRYSLMTAFGVCPEDDDGNAAVSVAMINADQMAIIPDLASAAGVSIVTVLKTYKAKSLDQLTAEQAAAAIRRLNLSIDKKTEEKEAA